MSAARDPAGRREAILEATLEVIAEVGVARATHRAIADRAGVPLGSTTYYFPSQQALTTEALERVADRCREQVREWEQEIATGSNLAVDLARLAHDYLSDHDRALLEYELYLAAARSPELRVAARAWLSGLRAYLAPLVGGTAAVGIAALIDGFLLDSIATGETVSRADLEAAIARLIVRPGELAAELS
ncbi:TetR/AcrR family transcriptional regulator [Solicola gregarius]|uniref:TetR family transcriptional regulator n=1 Tax=Solicola gregarius TaxID=2908642 RepID=A0AA46TG39_9ACTN|nr:TetR family transcriptional regulator [Solicola gregarius]UYM04719.1 TetR family transcriptional regulator [Solicola gregarius]